MIRIAIRKVRPDKREKLEAWLGELNSRADEVRATFVDETVTAEQACIIEGRDGPLLIYVIEAADLGRGAKAFAESAHRIDAEQKAVMRECLDGTVPCEPLYDVHLDGEAAAAADDKPDG